MMKQQGASSRRSWVLMLRLKEFRRSPLHRAPIMSLSGCIAAWLPEIFSLTSAKSKQACLCRRRCLTGGRWRGRRLLRPASYYVGRRTGGKCVPTAKSLPAEKLSARQTAQHRLLEFSGGPPRSLLSAIHVITEHPGHHAVTAQEMDLKPMCLLLGARFGVDAADVLFRLRIGTFSSWHND